MNCLKRQPLENLYNFRDMGGYQGRGNKCFSYCRLFRSDVPDRLSPKEWDAVRELGICTIVDLRSESERTCMNYIPPSGIEVFALPMQHENKDVSGRETIDALAHKALTGSMNRLYKEILFDNLNKTVQILHRITDSLEQGAVLFHCSLGKDRTGILAGLVYYLLGISFADIIADYQVTEVYINQDKRVGSFFSDNAASLLLSRGDTMNSLLLEMEEKKVAEHLACLGFGAREVKRLESLLLK